MLSFAMCCPEARTKDQSSRKTGCVMIDERETEMDSEHRLHLTQFMSFSYSSKTLYFGTVEELNRPTAYDLVRSPDLRIRDGRLRLARNRAHWLSKAWQWLSAWVTYPFTHTAHKGPRFPARGLAVR